MELSASTETQDAQEKAAGDDLNPSVSEKTEGITRRSMREGSRAPKLSRAQWEKAKKLPASPRTISRPPKLDRFRA